MNDEFLGREDGIPDDGAANDESRDVAVGFEEQLAEMDVLERESDGAETPPSLTAVNARDWLSSESPPLDPIFAGMFDRGDKVVVAAAPKMRKTFMFTQMALCLAACRPFLKWEPTKPGRALLVQFEMKPEHFHRRVREVARALKIGPDDIGDRLHIISMRGLSADLPGIEQQAKALGADVIILDPLYKLIEGDENASYDMKPLLRHFDQIAERVGAALVYIHHDPKGSPGDRNIRDRGAGSNTLIRDCDVLITLTAHQNEDIDVAVVGILQRNYPPQEDFSVRWCGGAFEVAEEILAVPARSSSRGNQNPTTTTPLEEFLPEIDRVLDGCAIPKGVLIDRLKTKAGLTRVRATALVELALDGDEYVVWDKCYPKACWVGTEEAINAKIRELEERKQKTLFDDTGKQKKRARKKRQ